MSKLKELIESAKSQKSEMNWKVLAYDPEQDNKLVDEYKDFECFNQANMKKRELLEKNPKLIVQVMSESVQKNEAYKRISVNKTDYSIDDSSSPIRILPIRPYDESDYYKGYYDPSKQKAFYRTSSGKMKAGLIKYKDKDAQIKYMAQELEKLNKSIEPMMSYESAQKNEGIHFGQPNVDKCYNELMDVTFQEMKKRNGKELSDKEFEAFRPMLLKKYPKEVVDYCYMKANESAQKNEDGTSWKVILELRAPSSMNNKAVEDKLERVIESNGMTVLDVTAERY